MATDEPIIDSPLEWVAKHIRTYVETDGKQGHINMGMPTLLLTTRGRKSGKLHRTALTYGRDGERYIVVASSAGAPQDPSWYRNLVANPEVDLQVMADKFRARARTASPEEKAALWPTMTAITSLYNEYQEKAGRDIPVVILERV
jgi:deazaflavin-dependent oxidoreductase (nitroreductase family)